MTLGSSLEDLKAATVKCENKEHQSEEAGIMTMSEFVWPVHDAVMLAE